MGKRGPQKGAKYKPTLEKAAAKELLRKLLMSKLEPVADALISRCIGVRYFVTRNKKTGKYELVTNPDQVVAALNGEDEQTGEFYTDKPETAAIREFLDRTMDKAPQPVKVGGDEDSGPVEHVFRWKA